MGSLDQYIHRVTHGPPFKSGEEMAYEMLRLASFSNWPKWCAKRPTELASQGFYSVGKGTILKCYACQIELNADGDDLATKHGTNCTLFKSTEVGRADSGFCDVSMEEHEETFPRLIVTAAQPVAEMQNAPGMSNKHASDAAFEIEPASGGSTPIEPVNPSQIFEPTSELDLNLVRFEGYRLGTFEGRWSPESFVSPADLAKDGFYYIGPLDKVQCAFCKGRLLNWKPADNPMSEHRRHYSNCPFVQGADVGNVPAVESTNNKTRNTNKTSMDETPAGRLGIVLEKPKHVEFARENKRLDTYKAWPKKSSISCKNLAEAGLFYTGYSDHVMCFFCGGKLGNWEAGDDPWQEHMQFYPTCGFLKLSKGLQEEDRETLPLVPAKKPDNLNIVAERTGNSKSSGKNLVPIGGNKKKGKKTKSGAITNSVNQEKQTKKESSKRTGSSVTGDITLIEDDEYRDLKKKYEELTEERICKICMDGERTIVFLPCGHTVCCSNCAPALQSCPICRNRIKGSVRINVA